MQRPNPIPARIWRWFCLVGGLFAAFSASALEAPGWMPDGLVDPPSQGPWLCQGRYMTPDEGKAVLDAFLQAHPVLPEWERFRNKARMHILQGAGLHPLPERTPLNPVITKRREYDGYSVENVRFESIPGYWVTGNLYRPSDPGPHAAVLHTHGHSSAITGPASWIRHGRFKPDVQKRAAALARMGAVSLTIDMVGYGDSSGFLREDVHHTGTALTMHIWNAMRALDFLSQLEEVDASRLGVTGHSGGGTQAFLLSALDPRVKACVPVAMVSSWFFGGCECESGLPIHAGDAFFMNNAMIAALTAPRPLKLVSDGGDWTAHAPEIEFPFIREIYQLYGAEDQVAHTYIPDEGHDYGFTKRAAMYPFMARHLELNLSAIRDTAGAIDESKITVEDPILMRSFPGSWAIPANGLGTEQEIQRELEKRRPGKAQSSGLLPYDLRCDGIVNPLGIEADHATVSWKLKADYRGAEQHAYQLQLADDAGFSKDRVIWDSGPVQSGEQLNIPLGAGQLQSGTAYAWRVRVWNEKDAVSPWSGAATFTTGLEDWQASWISHPDWISFNREHLGYRSLSADTTDVEKWIQIDLGGIFPVERVVLRALRHTVAERLGFPQAFKVEISVDPGFRDPFLVADYTGEGYPNSWTTAHDLEVAMIPARFIRVTASRLRELNGEICLAFNQIEVIANGRNVAVGAEVTASDSLEEGVWSKEAVVDGKGTPGTNPLDNKTLLLRKTFRLDGDLDSAVLHLAGLGQYVLHLNGRRVGENKLTPAWTDARKTVLYDSLDVEPYLVDGENVITILLAGGMYSVADPEGRYTKFVGRSRPLKALARLDLLYEDGHSDRLVTDPSWKAAPGPVTYSHVYGGEDFDARVHDGKWNTVTFDDADWPAALEVPGPGGRLRGVSLNAPPMRTTEVLSPVAFQERGPGVTLYDLGQNAALMVRLEARGPAGSRIRVTPAELLSPDGGLDRGSVGGRQAWWQYTLAGNGDEAWESEFFYHGARYLRVERLPAAPGDPLPELLRIDGLVTHSVSAPAGDFKASSPLWNRTRELIRWAQRSNMVSVLTDCPHRERLGWLEQYHLNGPSLRYEFDLGRLYRKTFQDMADAQTPEGLVPDIAPEYIVFPGPFRDSPEWGSALILAAWQHYLFTGERAVLESHYDGMKAYFAYLKSKSRGHLLGHGLGDWYDLGPERPGFAQLTPVGLTATATFYENALRLADIARLLGKRDESAQFMEEAGNIRGAFQAEYYDTHGKLYATGSQTANAMPYVLGMMPDGDRPAVLDSLIADIRSRGNALTSGDVGHRYLLRALAGAGRSDIIWDLHHQSERPGYGYQLERGATSLTESWDAGRHSSQNHFMLGHIMEWFYADLAGISPQEEKPGFGLIEIRPQPVGNLAFARATYESPRGPVKVDWRRETGTFYLDVAIPANTSARILFPAPEGAAVLESGRPVEAVPGLPRVETEDGRPMIRIPSGAYSFQVSLQP